MNSGRCQCGMMEVSDCQCEYWENEDLLIPDRWEDEPDEIEWDDEEEDYDRDPDNDDSWGEIGATENLRQVYCNH